MQSFLYLLAACLFPILMLGCAADPEPREVDLVISSVTVIDPESRSVRPNQDVYIDDGRIVAIDHARPSATYSAKRAVHGGNRFLIPGLMDMHVHVAHPMFSSSTLKALLANGVTGVREMSGDCWEPRGEIFACIDDYRELQASIEAGETAGPRLLKISSAVVRGPFERQPPHVPEGAADFVTPSTPEDAREVVALVDERDVDLIKTYNALPRDAYYTLLEEANARGLEVSGHIPFPVSVVEASKRGHRSIEHAKALPWACSRFGDELVDMANRVLSGERIRTPGDIERDRKIMESFDLAKCNAVMQTLVENDTYYVPTHETREMDARASEESYRNDPRMQYVPAQLQGFWKNDLERTGSASTEAIDTFRRFFDYGLMVTRLAHSAGVKVMAGTDANDTMSFPGFSLHDELVHLSKAGLQPMDVLRAATTVPADYLGAQDRFGGVSVGKQADLVLLDADPLADIGNTTSIAAVILDGRLLERDDLDALLEDAKAGNTQ